MLRYVLAHRSLGRPSTLLVLVTFSSPTSLPSTEFLARRVTEVQHHWPLVSCTLIDQRSPRPKLKESPIPWTERDLLFQKSYESGAGELADRNWIGNDILHTYPSEVESPLEPLWRMTIYTSSVDPELRPAYFAFTVDHALIDGRGAIEFVRTLLEPESIEHLPYEDFSTYSTLADHLQARPRWTSILTAVFEALVAPRLPDFLRRWLGFPPTFPTMSQTPVRNCQWRSSFFDVDQSVVEKIKILGKENGVRTLNPILQTAWAFSPCALYRDTPCHRSSSRPQP